MHNLQQKAKGKNKFKHNMSQFINTAGNEQ